MHHALRQYASDGEPAMGLTADAVLAAGRRSRRTRRLAGWAGAGLAVALVGAGVVVAANGGSTGTDFAAATPCPFPPGSRPPGVIAADQPLSPQLVEWATTSVTCYLSAEVPRLLPAATYARRPGVSAGPLTGFSPGGEPPWGNRVDSMTVIRDARGAGDLSVFIGVVDQSAAAREKARCQREEAAQCTVQSGPNGETVLLSTERDPLPPATREIGSSRSSAATPRSMCRSRTPINPRGRTVTPRPWRDRNPRFPRTRPSGWRCHLSCTSSRKARRRRTSAGGGTRGPTRGRVGWSGFG